MTENAKISAWLSSNVKNYYEGVELIAEFGSQTMAASYRNASPRFMLPQVIALLRRLANSKQRPTDKPQQPPQDKPQQPPQDKPQIPEVVRTAKNLLHSLYLSMVSYHNALLSLGDENTDEKIKARVEIFKARQPYIDSFCELDALVKDYFATLEVPARLQELVDILTKPQQDPLPPSDGTKYGEFSDYELAKEYKRIKSRINRSINKLRFSVTRVMKELNPLPDGPLRKQVESELASYRAELKQIIVEQRKRGLIK